ncbi:hypothetical protein ACQXR1_04805 [Bacillus sp. ATD]
MKTADAVRRFQLMHGLSVEVFMD